MSEQTPDKDPLLLDHCYDGIQEYDNPMPRWWVWIFVATIVFSAAYIFDFTGTVRGPGRVAEYQASMAEAAKRWPPSSNGPDDATLARMLADGHSATAGKQVFTTSCAPCHRADGGGLIGPNLTDDYWLHGGQLAEIRHTISQGVLAKGMPEWRKMLKDDQITAVALYVASLHGSNPPSPKAPQGVQVVRR